MVAWRGWVRVVYWVGLSWFGGAGPNLFPGLVSVSLCVSCAPELPSLASYLRESLVSPLVLSLCYPFHRCRAYGDGAPLHCSASSASASSVHVCARLRAPSLPSVDLVILAVVCRAFRPSSVTCRYVARRHLALHYINIIVTQTNKNSRARYSQKRKSLSTLTTESKNTHL